MCFLYPHFYLEKPPAIVGLISGSLFFWGFYIAWLLGEYQIEPDQNAKILEQNLEYNIVGKTSFSLCGKIRFDLFTKWKG